MALLTRVKDIPQEPVFSISTSFTVENLLTDITASKDLDPGDPDKPKKVSFITEPIVVENWKLQKKGKKKSPSLAMEAHDNCLFQHDDDSSILKNAAYLSRFGKKGRDAGHLRDASDIKYVGNNVLLVTDMSNNRLQTFDVNGKVLNVCQLEKDSYPTCAIMTKAHQVAVTSCYQKSILVLSRKGEVLKTVGHGHYQRPFGIAQDPQSNRIAVTDQVSDSVTILDENFNHVQTITHEKASSRSLHKPRHVTFSGQGLMIVSDSGNHSVKIFDQNGSMVSNFGKFGRGPGELRAPYGVCVDQYGDILVADHYNDRVSCFDIRGQRQYDLICHYHGLRHPQGLTLTSGNKLCVSHGGLKATEIAVYDLCCLQDTNQDTRL